MRTILRVCFPVILIAVSFSAQAQAQRVKWTSDITAERGKQYRLTKDHGPWMIMVASFSEPPPGRRTEGMTPREAAEELVYELRKKRIPAYIYEQGSRIDHINTLDRLNRKSNRVYASRRGSVSVIAGNYETIDESTKKGRDAQRSLEAVQKFYPEFLQEVEATKDGIFKLSNGGIYRRTPGRPGPLSRAFLTLNPLLSPEEIQKAKTDPLLLSLNSESKLSLLNNPKKYTLVVASFYGNSITKVGNSSFKQAIKNFVAGENLDKAGLDAWELAKALRQAESLGYEQDYESYVFHDRHRSLVTVGSFDNPHDPQIKVLQQKFGAKAKPSESSSRNMLLGEFFTIPRRPKPGTLPEKKWLFDPQPALMEVPRLR